MLYTNMIHIWLLGNTNEIVLPNISLKLVPKILSAFNLSPNNIKNADKTCKKLLIIFVK